MLLMEPTRHTLNPDKPLKQVIDDMDDALAGVIWDALAVCRTSEQRKYVLQLAKDQIEWYLLDEDQEY